jgi:hypothetical protein
MSREYCPHLSRFGRHRPIVIGVLSLALAACSGEGPMPVTNPAPGPGAPAGDPAPGTGDGSGDDSPDGAAMLDCIRDDYPCSFGEVELSVIERSLALSDEAADQLESGLGVQQVAAFLALQSDVVEVIVDEPVLAFRLAAGRLMIVDVTGEQEFMSIAAAARVPSAEKPRLMEQASAAPKRSTVRSAVTSKISAGDNSQRNALVLSPFRYEEDFGNSGEWVADALNGVRGYAGNVTYLATTDELDPKVNVEVLTRLLDYDVVHIDTHGGTICKGTDAPSKELAKDKGKEKCANGITDFLVQRFHGTAQDLQSIAHPGVIHYRGRSYQSIAITADFFRHYYPEGLADRLFILGSCNTFRSDMADAVAGPNGIYVSWDGNTEFSLVKNTSLALLEFLGQGLTVGEAFMRLPSFSPENPDAQGSTLKQTGRRAGGDLRIRDLITVRDNLTGKLVTDVSGIEVIEVPGDGQKDNLDLEFTVDGISPEQLANFYVNLVVDDHVIGHLDMKQSGVQVDDFRYMVSTPVPLPFDVQEGQRLNMDFWIPLPDLGEDHFIAAPSVNTRETPDVGYEWVLSSRATQSRIDDTTIMTAFVIFELEPDDDPDARFHFFRVRSGSVQIRREYEDALGCHFNINHSIDIPAGAMNNYLRFDTGSQKMMLKGFGSVASESLKTLSSCGTSANVSVGGTYFVADDTPVPGDSVQGGYNSGSAFPTIIEWDVTRTQ